MRNLLLFGCFVFSIFACRPPQIQVEETGMGKDFDEFYARFHSDSLYQMSHIRFPLHGATFNSDSVKVASNPTPWTPENWTFQQKPEIGNEFNYEIAISPVFKDVVIERLLHLQTGFSIERRFRKDATDQQWYLIYYMDSNKVR